MIHRPLTRRAFVTDLGRGGIAIAIFGLTAMACSSDDPSDAASTTSGESPATSSNTPPATSAPATTAPGTAAPSGEAVTWERVNLGFVSAYILARHGEAAIVDTGVSGSAGAIEASLTLLDLGWGDVSTVILTHLHNDHQGSLPAVMDRASGATGYAGAADIPGISSPRALIAVGDGDRVFDLTIIDTPGHTAGHISVLDEIGGLLVAGDAMNGQNGGVAGANPQFTSDMELAGESIKKLAGYTYDTVVFGHGEPVVGAASQQVAELAAEL